MFHHEPEFVDTSSLIASDNMEGTAVHHNFDPADGMMVNNYCGLGR